MTHSMTGFARLELIKGTQTYSLEIKAVNHRYFELSIRLPEDKRPLEASIRVLLSKHIKRGKVDVWVNAKTTPHVGSAVTPVIDQTTLSQWVGLVKELQNEAGRHGVDLSQPSVFEALKWPGLVKEPINIDDLADDDLMQSIADLTHQFNQTRRSEGERLEVFIKERLEQLDELVVAVRNRLPEVQTKLRNRLTERLNSVNTDVPINPDRFEHELLLQLQKMDVEEELNRLSGHRLEILKALDGQDAAGRRLDFLMQELNREANTLSSKSADSDTTRMAVDMKVLIEQMREQVQNVE